MRKTEIFRLIPVGESFTAKTVWQIRALAQQALADGHRILVFDLSKCREFDSSAVGLVFNAYKRLSSLQGRLVFLKASADICDIIHMAGADIDLFCDSTEDVNREAP